MQVAAGAMSPLLRKLGDLLMAELSLDKRTRKGIESLRRELPVMLAALHMVGEVPPEQLDPVVKAWAHQVRELSYDMEDAVDAYMVRVEEEGHKPANLKNRVKKFVRKTSRLFTKGKDLRQIVTSIMMPRTSPCSWTSCTRGMVLTCTALMLLLVPPPSILASCRCTKMSESLWASVVEPKS